MNQPLLDFSNVRDADGSNPTGPLSSRSRSNSNSMHRSNSNINLFYSHYNSNHNNTTNTAISNSNHYSNNSNNNNSNTTNNTQKSLFQTIIQYKTNDSQIQLRHSRDSLISNNTLSYRCKYI